MSSSPARWIKTLASSVIVLGIVCLALEIGLRVILSIKVGPDVLFFGTEYCCGPQKLRSFDEEGSRSLLAREFHTVNNHRNAKQNYSKYFPNQQRVDHNRAGETFSVAINSQGFRGKEFSQARPTGVIRIITLGASSTFGYYDKDNETYPYYLEEMLNDRRSAGNCGEIKSFEVINMAIPHMTTTHILGLFSAEGARLSPDVVTFYQGVNNSAEGYEAFREEGLWASAKGIYGKVMYTIQDRLITLALMDNLLAQQGTPYSASDVSKHSEGKAALFIEDLAALRAEVHRAGSLFIVANQQAKSDLFDENSMRGVTYREEVDKLKEILFSGERVSKSQMFLLLHASFMSELELWAKQNQLPFVDVIKAMDERRDHLLSWVHLSPDGNKIVAKAFADPIASTYCNEAQAILN